jgi:hypothetical protein
VNRIIAPNNLIFNSSKIGGIDDVYDGFDFDVNARLGRGFLVSGGVGIGRERVDNCNLIGDLSLSYTGPRIESYCNQRPPFQPQVKGQISYPLPWDINAAATFQSLSGPGLNANYPLTNAIAFPSLGRNFTNVPPTVDLLAPSTLYGDRVFQTDVRFSRTIRAGGTTIRPTVSIYNLFNANPVQTYNNTFGPAWLGPTVILQSRFADLGVQIDF